MMVSLIGIDYRSGVSLSPLVVCRLLLVMDYLLYQFSGPPPQLTEQVYFQNKITPKRKMFCHIIFVAILSIAICLSVLFVDLAIIVYYDFVPPFNFQINHNLFSASPVGLHVSPGGSSLTHATEQPTRPPNIMHYSCEQQLQYYTVLSKPGSTVVMTNAGVSTGEAGKGGKKKEKGTTTARPKSQTPDIGMKCTLPKFYNVRPVAVMDESQPQPEIDEEVCV